MSDLGFVGAPEKPILLVLQTPDRSVGVALISASASGWLKGLRWSCTLSAPLEFSQWPDLLSSSSLMSGSHSSPSPAFSPPTRRSEGDQMPTTCSTSSSCLMTAFSFRTPTPTVRSAVMLMVPSMEERPPRELAVLGGGPSLLSPPVMGRSSPCSLRGSSLGFPLENAERVLFPAHMRLRRTDLLPLDRGGLEESLA